MKKDLENFLSYWPVPLLTDADFYCHFDFLPTQAKRDLVHRAFEWGWLTPIKRGLYLINSPFQKELPNPLEMAQHIYGPSYISLESALSYYQLIPEAVKATVSVTPKRKAQFFTPQGTFLFHHTPVDHFFESVVRIKQNGTVFLMATPLKALGDYIYVTKKSYQRSIDIADDLRIEHEQLKKISKNELKKLIKNYPSKNVQKFYKNLAENLYL